MSDDLIQWLRAHVAEQWGSARAAMHEAADRIEADEALMRQALEALEQIDPYVDRLVDYSSTAAEWPLNLAPRRVALSIAALRARLGESKT